MVLSSGVLRSMSRPGGVGAHAHVGDGHASTYGMGLGWMGDWRCRVVVKKRGVRVGNGRVRARRRRGSETSILVCVGGLRMGDGSLGELIVRCAGEIPRVDDALADSDSEISESEC